MLCNRVLLVNVIEYYWYVAYLCDRVLLVMAHKEVQPSGQRESGYDYNFVNPVPDRLVCNICQFPCCKTQLTECCGHVYCQPCVEKVKTVADREYSCPMCREVNFKTIAHHEADRTIKELLIYCPNNKEGWGKCSWTGALGNINRHLKNCKVECRRCGVSLGYHAMRRHLATLSCQCKYCHSKKKCCCQVACPNKCGQDVLRDKIAEHKKVCPSERVECKYQCGVKLARYEIEKHYQTCKHQVKDFQLINNEKFKNIYEEIKSNGTKILETKNNIKQEIDTLKQSVAIIQQTTMNYCIRYENILSCNSFLLLIILALLACLMVTTVQTPIDKVITNVNEVTSQNNHKTSEVSQTNKFETFWLLKYDVTDKQHHDKTLPVILKMTDFAEKKKNKEPWYSDPFFVSKDGCQMCLRVDASGYADQKDTFISIHLYVKDHHDITNHCKWPLTGKFSVELLNQYSDNIHHQRTMMVVNNPYMSEFEFANTNFIFSGLGYYNFISHKILSGSRHIYSANDTLYFRVLYEDKPTNIVHKHRYVEIYEYFYNSVLKHLLFPCITLGVVQFIFEVTQAWITNGTMLVLIGMAVLFSVVFIGIIAIGNLLGGILWLVSFILGSLFKMQLMQLFPNEELESLAFVCMLLPLLAAKLLLVDVLHMQRDLSWEIF